MSKKTTVKGVIVGLAAVLAVLVLMVILLPGGENGPETTQPTGQTAPSATTENLAALELPLKLESGLILENLFQYTGINPDCENQEGTDVVAASLRNDSGTYLTQALITVTLTDGNCATFEVTDLPAGATVMAFSREQTSTSAKPGCHAVSCTVSPGLGTVAIPEQVEVSAEGTTVRVTNKTDQPLTNLVIYCRNILETEYFGGVTYQYTIENIPAHETVTLEALDCILGMADVVRVELDHE